MPIDNPEEDDPENWNIQTPAYTYTQADLETMYGEYFIPTGTSLQLECNLCNKRAPTATWIYNCVYTHQPYKPHSEMRPEFLQNKPWWKDQNVIRTAEDHYDEYGNVYFTNTPSTIFLSPEIYPISEEEVPQFNIPQINVSFHDDEIYCYQDLPSTSQSSETYQAEPEERFNLDHYLPQSNLDHEA